MSGVVFQVPPLSRLQIRQVARKIRAINKELTGEDGPFFPIVEFLDITLPKHFSDFVLEILPESEMGDAHGLTYPDEHLIQIRSDVYERACQNEGRDRMTLAHELGHYVLHPGAGFARMTMAESIPAYRSSEWQANAFGGELLISADHIHKCRNPSEAALMFGVSRDAAAVQWKAFGRK